MASHIDTGYIGTKERRSLCTLFPRVDLDLRWNQNTSSHRSDGLRELGVAAHLLPVAMELLEGD